MSARLPATVNFSMAELARHGGLTGPHIDGWGTAFYDGNDALILREPQPAADSVWMEFLKRHQTRSHYVLSHIRKATQGERALANTQPFSREMAGRLHVFAHNGMLPSVESQFARDRFLPIGDTDSEIAFCILLEGLRLLWQDHDEPPPLVERARTIGQFAAKMRGHGPANFVYCDGDALFVHAHRRKQPGGELAPPGLWTLRRHCRYETSTQMSGVVLHTRAPRQVVTMVASVPLTDEDWKPLAEGSLHALRDGEATDLSTIES